MAFQINISTISLSNVLQNFNIDLLLNWQLIEVIQFYVLEVENLKFSRVGDLLGVENGDSHKFLCYTFL